MWRVWLRVENIGCRRLQTTILPVLQVSQSHVHVQMLPQLYPKCVISFKYLTVCHGVDQRPSEQWKPIFQLNYETAVQLKTSSGRLHNSNSQQRHPQPSGISTETLLSAWLTAWKVHQPNLFRIIEEDPFGTADTKIRTQCVYILTVIVCMQRLCSGLVLVLIRIRIRLIHLTEVSPGSTLARLGFQAGRTQESCFVFAV